MDKSIKVKTEPGIGGGISDAKSTIASDASTRKKNATAIIPTTTTPAGTGHKANTVSSTKKKDGSSISSVGLERKTSSQKADHGNNGSSGNNNGTQKPINGSKIQVKLEKIDDKHTTGVVSNNNSVLRDKTNLNTVSKNQNDANGNKKGNNNKQVKLPEKKNVDTEKLKMDRIKEFMMEIPEIKGVETRKGNGVMIDNKFSSPFANQEEKNITGKEDTTTASTLKGKGKARSVRFNELNEDSDSNLSNLKLRDSSDGEQNSSFLSSPCVERKMKQKRSREGNDCRTDDDLVKKMRLNVHKKEVSRRSEESNGNEIMMMNENENENENDHMNSMDATNGSDEEYEPKEEDHTVPPPKYQVEYTPIYEYMKGEESIYQDILGKKGDTEELDENEKMFMEFANYGYEQWCEQSMKFSQEYNEIMKKIMTARIKFDSRVKYLKDNLDKFAINLEKRGEELNKRSEILKDYCEKIVKEID